MRNINFNSCKKQQTSQVQAEYTATTLWLEQQKQVFITKKSWLDSLKNDISSDVSTSDFDSSRLLVIYRLNVATNDKANSFLASFFDHYGTVLQGDLIDISNANSLNMNQISDITKGALLIKIQLGNFNGDVSISMVNQDFITGLSYRNGQMSARKNLASGISLKKTSSLARTVQEIEKIETVDPSCTDWYYVVTDLETREIVSVTYAYSVCPGGGDSGGGSGAGSATSIEKWEVVADASPSMQSRLCSDQVFNFKTIGSSFTAEVDGLGVSLVGPKGEFFNILLGASCITIPNYKLANASQASTALIEGYNQAIGDLVSELQEGTLLPRQAAIAMRLKQLVIQNISLSAGLSSGTGAAISTGGCQGTVPVNTAKYC